jgi:hypothetical protein
VWYFFSGKGLRICIKRHYRDDRQQCRKAKQFETFRHDLTFCLNEKTGRNCIGITGGFTGRIISGKLFPDVSGATEINAGEIQDRLQ